MSTVMHELVATSYLKRSFVMLYHDNIKSVDVSNQNVGCSLCLYMVDIGLQLMFSNELGECSFSA